MAMGIWFWLYLAKVDWTTLVPLSFIYSLFSCPSGGIPQPPFDPRLCGRNQMASASSGDAENCENGYWPEASASNVQMPRMAVVNPITRQRQGRGEDDGYANSTTFQTLTSDVNRLKIDNRSNGMIFVFEIFEVFRCAIFSGMGVGSIERLSTFWLLRANEQLSGGWSETENDQFLSEIYVRFRR